jgi:thaumatin family protein
MFGRNGRRRRAGLSGALTTTALLGAITLTAGCAALGTGGANGANGANGAGAGAAAAGSQRPLTAAASNAAGGATAATAAKAATRTPSPSGRSAMPTLARMPSATPASSASSAPAASEPTPSGAAGSRRLVTFVNRMSQTIWVAAAPNSATPLAATGWDLPAGQSVTIITPNNLNTRFWGRTGCVFNSEGVGHCQTGDCGGLFQCKGWGTIPATLAEVNFDAWDSLDFYDVSMVDGSNLPMYINITKSSDGTKDKVSPDGCVPAGCTKPVVCPSVLDVKVGSAVVGCISACARLGTDQLCCRGQWSSRAACNPAEWPVDYAAVFKRAEPYAYSYVDDDATSVFTCKGVCDYRITFGITP